MTEQQIDLVQKSYQKVDAISDTAAGIFYEKLFELDPELKSTLFRQTDIAEQGKKLMSMIKMAIAGLSNLEKLVPAVQQLGQRHSQYGVEEKHYETVGSALIYTLGAGLGDEFNEDLNEAWVTCYTLLARTMKDAV